MIQVKHLKKNFGKIEVLKDISVDIKEKEVVCVIGPSGSGKSTFLRCLNKLEDITSGQVIIDGQDITDPHVDMNKVRQEVGMVFQQFNLFPHKTVIENIILAPVKVKGVSEKEAIERGISLLKKSGSVKKPTATLTNYQAGKNRGWPSPERWQ